MKAPTARTLKLEQSLLREKRRREREWQHTFELEMPLDWLDATATHSSRGKSAGLKPQTDPKAARGVAGDALGSHKKKIGRIQTLM